MDHVLSRMFIRDSFSVLRFFSFVLTCYLDWLLDLNRQVVSAGLSLTDI